MIRRHYPRIRRSLHYSQHVTSLDPTMSCPYTVVERRDGYLCQQRLATQQLDSQLVRNHEGVFDYVVRWHKTCGAIVNFGHVRLAILRASIQGSSADSYL